jgi:hypothetical protein
MQTNKRPAYHGLLMTIAGQAVYITLFDDGDHWVSYSGIKYNKTTGEDEDRFGVLDLDTITIMSEDCW